MTQSELENIKALADRIRFLQGWLAQGDLEEVTAWSKLILEDINGMIEEATY